MVLQIDYHNPVLVKEVVAGLQVKHGEKYIDATLGGGGHTSEILKSGGIVLGIDADEEALKYVKSGIENKTGKFIGKDLYLKQGNFKDIKRIAIEIGFEKVAGIIFDLGLSSFQLDYGGMGFSFAGMEFLDMRIDKSREIKAFDIINKYKEKELYDIFTKYSEELNSGDIASAVVRARAINPIKTSADLSKIILGVLEKQGNKRGGRDVLARIFQAIRIEVNNEIENIKESIWKRSCI